MVFVLLGMEFAYYNRQLHRWNYRCVFAGKRVPRVRLCGRSAHEASASSAKAMGAARRLGLSPLAACDAAAPVISKKMPA